MAVGRGLNSTRGTRLRPACFQQYAPAKKGLKCAVGLGAHSNRPRSLSIPFRFNNPNTNINHNRISPLSIP